MQTIELRRSSRARSTIRSVQGTTRPLLLSLEHTIIPPLLTCIRLTSPRATSTRREMRAGPIPPCRISRTPTCPTPRVRPTAADRPERDVPSKHGVPAVDRPEHSLPSQRALPADGRPESLSSAQHLSSAQRSECVVPPFWCVSTVGRCGLSLSLLSAASGSKWTLLFFGHTLSANRSTERRRDYIPSCEHWLPAVETVNRHECPVSSFQSVPATEDVKRPKCLLPPFHCSLSAVLAVERSKPSLLAPQSASGVGQHSLSSHESRLSTTEAIR